MEPAWSRCFSESVYLNSLSLVAQALSFVKDKTKKDILGFLLSLVSSPKGTVVPGPMVGQELLSLQSSKKSCMGASFPAPYFPSPLNYLFIELLGGGGCTFIFFVGSMTFILWIYLSSLALKAVSRGHLCWASSLTIWPWAVSISLVFVRVSQMSMGRTCNFAAVNWVCTPVLDQGSFYHILSFMW